MGQGKNPRLVELSAWFMIIKACQIKAYKLAQILTQKLAQSSLKVKVKSFLFGTFLLCLFVFLRFFQKRSGNFTMLDLRNLEARITEFASNDSLIYTPTRSVLLYQACWYNLLKMTVINTLIVVTLLAGKFA